MSKEKNREEKKRKGKSFNEPNSTGCHPYTCFFFSVKRGKAVISTYTWGRKKENLEMGGEGKIDEKKHSGGLHPSPGFHKGNSDSS